MDHTTSFRGLRCRKAQNPKLLGSKNEIGASVLNPGSSKRGSLRECAAAVYAGPWVMAELATRCLARCSGSWTHLGLHPQQDLPKPFRAFFKMSLPRLTRRGCQPTEGAAESGPGGIGCGLTWGFRVDINLRIEMADEELRGKVLRSNSMKHKISIPSNRPDTALQSPKR